MRLNHCIAGQGVDSRATETTPVHNPSTGEVIALYQEAW